MRKRPAPAKAQPARSTIRSVGDRIIVLRGLRVILDRDLAQLYGVNTGALNQAVSRNRSRFPADFAFTINRREAMNLISQSVISSSHGGPRQLPRAFSEHGIAMLSSVLRSERAVAANIAIMRAFVRLRDTALSQAELARRIANLERRYDGKFAEVFGAIRRLVGPPAQVQEPRRRIGFVVDCLPVVRTRATT